MKPVIPALILVGALGASSFGLAQSAHAVVLKQKWQVGQTLVYNVDLDGTANVQLPSDAPSPLAGVPLEVQLRGKGITSLNTLKVDELGTGTIAVSVPKWNFDAQTLGQKANWTLQDGKSQFTLNGRRLAIGPNAQQTLPVPPALKIAANGQFKGVEKLDDAPKTGEAAKADAAKADAAKADAANDAPVAPGAAIDQGALAAAAFLRAFPALWPERDLKIGDKWQANVDLPALARPAQNGQPSKPLGVFDLKLEGQDIVGGKTLQRVSIKGDIDVDGRTVDRLTPPAKATDAAQGKAQPRLDHATQTVEGQIWLNAATGQVAKTELVLGGRAQGQTPKADGKPGAPAWLDFTGTLNMNLQ
jgi:hypothetical protein